MIIAIEGADGAGKATQTTLLAEKLGGTRLAFPDYDQPCGKAILGHLQWKWEVARVNDEGEPIGTGYDPTGEHERLDALVFQALQTVNRLELLPVINAVLATGKPLVFDRYSASAMVYGKLDGLDPAWLEVINASLPQPDVWIYLDIPIEESFKRRPERRDRYESDRPYLEKVRDKYLKLFAEKGPHYEGAHIRGSSQWHIIDGLGTVDQVHERIMSVIK